MGAELSVHEAIRAEHDTTTSVAQLAAEYETIAAAAQHTRWIALIRNSGLTDGQTDAVINADGFGALTSALRLAEAHHYDPEILLPRLVSSRAVDGAEDIAAVLHHRALTTIRRGGGRPRPAPRLIVGLFPAAVGPMEPDMRVALETRRELLEKRADALVDTAISQRDPWIQRLGRPSDLAGQRRWRRALATVVAYRDRYHITDPTNALGRPRSEALRPDAARAAASLGRLAAAANHTFDSTGPHMRWPQPSRSPHRSL